MRPRKNKTNLPPCMYFKHGRHWFVKKGKWHKLPTDYAQALQQYARLNSPGGGLKQMLARVLENPKLAKNTRDQYEMCIERIDTAFQNFDPHQIAPVDVRRFLDAYRKTPNMANRMRTVLKLAMEHAVNAGYAETNPVSDIKPFPEESRSRYITDDEYVKIRNNARPYIGLMMDLAYLTGQRVMDIVLLKETEVRAGGVYFEQIKTGNRVEVEINEAITATLDAARALHRVRGTYVFHKGNGKPYSYFTIRDAFKKACTKAGVKDAQFRDIRAKSATDAEEDGLNPTLLLGHHDSRTTKRYLRKKRTIKATGPKSIGQVLDK